MKKVAWVLVIVGALNWGLVGLGWLVGGRDWNLVHLIFGQWMAVEAIVYLLVGVSAVMACTGKCGCRSCDTSAPKQM